MKKRFKETKFLCAYCDEMLYPAEEHEHNEAVHGIPLPEIERERLYPSEIAEIKYNEAVDNYDGR